MGFDTEEIGNLVRTSKDSVPISGVCAVFAESEVINHLSHGSAPADIMYGAMVSLVDRSAQLMKRVRMEPEVTLAGGILRFPTMADVIREKLDMAVNMPSDDLVQFLRRSRSSRPGSPADKEASPRSGRAGTKRMRASRLCAWRAETHIWRKQIRSLGLLSDVEQLGAAMFRPDALLLQDGLGVSLRSQWAAVARGSRAVRRVGI